jgi:hypothetical protein
MSIKDEKEEASKQVAWHVMLATDIARFRTVGRFQGETAAMAQFCAGSTH